MPMKQFESVRVLVLLTALTFPLFSFGFAWSHLSSPSDGARLGPDEPFGEAAWMPDGILATPLEENIDGMHQNDLIVAVDGTSIDAWVNTLTILDYPRPRWAVGQT